jgi:hypothetical protein
MDRRKISYVGCIHTYAQTDVRGWLGSREIVRVGAVIQSGGQLMIMYIVKLKYNFSSGLRLSTSHPLEENGKRYVCVGGRGDLYMHVAG